MGKSIVVEGKTSTEAIEKGLKELGLTKDCVDVKILEETDKKTFFSILTPRVVKVELTVKDNVSKKPEVQEPVKKERKEPSQEDVDKCKENISKFLESFCKAYGDITFEIEQNEKDLKVLINDDENTKLIGYRG